ncbi:MAG TPA: saccharopine dehydrogenase NADP-binding domain-containing protein [Solirubrobacteraceae bacterium]
MRVAVLGAGGTIARAIVRDLAQSPEVSDLALIDLDLPAAQRVAEDQSAGKGRAVGVDGSDRLAEAIDGCAVLVNAASYRINLDAMEAALAVGCHYVDLGGLYWMTARQLELDERFIAANLVGVLGMGAAPGKTNVMAARAVRELGGERPDEILISAAGRDPVVGDRLRLPYALRTLIDELTMAAVVLRDGAAVELPALSSGGLVDFPEPIGPAETIYTLHSELQTLGRSFGVQRASFRLSLPPALLGRLEGLLDADEDELAAVAAASVPPSELAIAAHVVEARSARRVARITAVTRPHEAWGLGGGIVSTAAPAAAVVRLIARGRIEPVGVLPPEDCVEPDDLFPELEQRGCTFAVEVGELV